MNKLPKVSVIVAVHNQERYIGRCLRSLLHQTLMQDDYEIIAVDDGSTDRTAYALELFCDPSGSTIKVIRNHANLGLPATLNVGIRSSGAPYVVRVDSDDFVNTNFLNFLSSYLDFNQEAAAVACDYFLLNDREEIIEKKDCIESPIACGIMFRKQCLVDIGLYDEDFRYHEERELRIRFEKKYSIHRLGIPLYRYRKHENNMTNNKQKMDQYANALDKKHGGKDS